MRKLRSKQPNPPTSGQTTRSGPAPSFGRTYTSRTAHTVATITYKGENAIFGDKVILVETPYKKEFVEALKTNIPAKKRLYSDYDKAWIVIRDQFDRVAAICEKYFNEVNLVDFPLPEIASTSWSTLYLVEGAPLEVVRAVYKALAQKYHPDKGGDVGTMQSINAAYKDIMGEFKNGD